MPVSADRKFNAQWHPPTFVISVWYQGALWYMKNQSSICWSRHSLDPQSWLFDLESALRVRIGCYAEPMGGGQESVARSAAQDAPKQQFVYLGCAWMRWAEVRHDNIRHHALRTRTRTRQRCISPFQIKLHRVDWIFLSRFKDKNTPHSPPSSASGSIHLIIFPLKYSKFVFSSLMLHFCASILPVLLAGSFFLGMPHDCH